MTMVDQEYLFCCCHLWLSFVICNLWLWLLFYDMMERKENTVPTILTTDTVRTVEVKLCVSSGQGLVPTGTDSPIIRHPGIGGRNLVHTVSGILGVRCEVDISDDELLACLIF